MCSFIRKSWRHLLSGPRVPRREADACLGFENASAAAERHGIATERCQFAACGLAERFMRDRSGAYGVMFGLVAPFFIAALALGSETGKWYSIQQTMQGAADSSAISAAVGLNAGNTNVALQADAVSASYNFVNGSNSTTVTVNNPPLSGSYVANSGAVEVIIKQPQKTLFSSLFLTSPVVIEGRAVAVSSVPCVLALNGLLGIPILPGITEAALANVLADQCDVNDDSPSPLALTVAALANMTALKVNVVGGYVDVLGTITATQGIHTGVAVTADPFAGTTVPAFSTTCDPHSAKYGTITSSVTLSPGTYCGGLSVGTGAAVTLSSGTYYFDGALLSPGLLVATGGSVTGTGVTIVLTSSTGLFSNLANVDFGGLLSGGVINLTAPSSGLFANLVVFVDPLALASVVTFRGGTQNSFVGTIYAPYSQVAYALGSGTKTGQCTRLIANTINFLATGASFSKCAVTLGPSSAAPATLVE
jgi:Flp pilus assembly protein TadG